MIHGILKATLTFLQPVIDFVSEQSKLTIAVSAYALGILLTGAAYKCYKYFWADRKVEKQNDLKDQTAEKIARSTTQSHLNRIVSTQTVNLVEKPAEDPSQSDSSLTSPLRRMPSRLLRDPSLPSTDTKLTSETTESEIKDEAAFSEEIPAYTIASWGELADGHAYQFEYIADEKRLQLKPAEGFYFDLSAYPITRDMHIDNKIDAQDPYKRPTELAFTAYLDDIQWRPQMVAGLQFVLKDQYLGFAFARPERIVENFFGVNDSNIRQHEVMFAIIDWTFAFPGVSAEQMQQHLLKTEFFVRGNELQVRVPAYSA